jgi:NAD(P)-dependent dehydrogenase (short-subunit alcohol dehydrogenase family)
MPDLLDRTAIVTGANSGIGFHTARILASKGAHVVMGCRNMEKAKRALDRILSEHPNARATVEALDLADLDNVNQFCDRFKAEHKRLDILVNNAGVVLPTRALSPQGHEMHFAINHLGHFALTLHLLNELIQAPHGRIITVSSIAHRWGKIRFHDLKWTQSYNMWRAYGQSKLANLLFTFELDRRLRSAGHSTRAMAAHPGITTSDIMRESAWMHKGVPLVGQSAELGSWTTIRASTDPAAEGGSFWGPRWCFQMWGSPQQVGCSRRARDPALATRLWDASEALTDLRFSSR